jgi:hypothetical protein
MRLIDVLYMALTGICMLGTALLLWSAARTIVLVVVAITLLVFSMTVGGGWPGVFFFFLVLMPIWAVTVEWYQRRSDG